MESREKANVRVEETSKRTCRAKIQEMVENGYLQRHVTKTQVQETIVLNSSP